ncbi:MAG: UDP-N-acetylglucosamine 1-carboxyvinyltransferase [Candidatus Andersenbacteria bacterium]
MDMFVVQGRRRLAGEIAVNGAKNEVLKLLPACVLIPGAVHLTNVPIIQGVRVMVELINALGGTATLDEANHTLDVDARGIRETRLPDALVTQERGTAVFAGPMLARFGEVTIHHPGGDVIGERPLDLLLDGLASLGAKVATDDRTYKLSGRLRGGRFVFKKISWTVTENLMLAATLGGGTTELINAALRPEVVALADFLNAHGARIPGAGTPTIRIEGVKELRTNGNQIAVMPDRFEAGTFACLAALTNSDVKITHCNPRDMEVFLKVLELTGAKIERGDDYLHLKKHKGLRATDVVTHEYPGLNTDYQAPLTLLLTQATGVSLVHETIFEGRLFFTDKLKQMGARIIMADPHRVIVEGPSQLTGRKIISPDLRAGIVLVMAGLIAEGTTTIGNIYQIERGYERIDERLRALGADIQRVSADKF